MRPAAPLLSALLIACSLTSFVAPAAFAGEPAASDDPARNAIRVYQRHLSAMRHLHCRFSPSCSQYAIDALARHGVVEGSARAADRLMRCNPSSDLLYPRNADGLLVDPVDGGGGGAAVVRAPRWLLLERERGTPPARSALAPERRARLDETVAFAGVLEQRGDCERASAEHQRAAFLADTTAAHAWAYANIADCYFRSGQWFFADRACLTAAMLSSEPRLRSTVGFMAAASRFNSGAYRACAVLLADPELAQAEPARTATLTGLCEFATGDWTAAERSLQRATLEFADSASAARANRLAAYAASGRALPTRSPAVAGTLSALLPGSGQVYAGRAKDGVRHLLFNAALVYTVASLASNEQVPASVIVGSVALPFYVGNVLGARDAARSRGVRHRMAHLERAIENSER